MLNLQRKNNKTFTDAYLVKQKKISKIIALILITRSTIHYHRLSFSVSFLYRILFMSKNFRPWRNKNFKETDIWTKI